MTVKSIAKALAEARVQGRKLDAYPGDAPASETLAFSMQCEAAEMTGWTQTGWKIGCTSKMAQAIRLVEPEIAFTMARDLPRGVTAHSVEDVLGAAASVHLSLELVNRRLPGGLEDGNMWNIADGGCNDAFVLGPPHEVLPAGAYAPLQLTVNKNGQPETTGVGVNALGGPDIALTWLANYLNTQSMMLKSKDVITTGVVTGLVYVAAGDEIVSACPQLGTVSAQYK